MVKWFWYKFSTISMCVIILDLYYTLNNANPNIMYIASYSFDIARHNYIRNICRAIELH